MLATLWSTLVAGPRRLVHDVATRRRLLSVARDPRRATEQDLEQLVRAHGVAEHRVWEVCDRVHRAALDPVRVWTWTMAYDGAALAELCESSLSDHDVAVHLSAGTVPELVRAA
ncbi:MAG: hypothetical protein CMH83_02180 [Nocardioides sp.]|nr:hypothetical protein [Nocardioides sp.]